MNKLSIKYYPLILLSVFLLNVKCTSQYVKKIYLIKVKNTSPHSSIEFDYKFNNQKDSNYVNIKYSGDFNRIFGVNYVFKDSLPNGKYEIYVDKTLKKVAFFNNKLKDSVWVEYLHDNTIRTIPFNRDTIDGIVKEFFKDKTLKRKSIIRKNEIVRRESYYQSGELEMQEYFKNERCVKIEYFNENGKILKETNLKKNYKKQMSNNNCINSVIDNGFVNQPFGQNTFRKSFLIDSLFKDVVYEESKLVKGKNDYIKTLNFYTGSYQNEYYFSNIQGSDIYLLTSAIIKNNNTPIHLKKGDKPIGIDYTKEYVGNLFKLNKTKICDSIHIKNKDDNSHLIIFFKDDLVKKIKINKQIN